MILHGVNDNTTTSTGSYQIKTTTLHNIVLVQPVSRSIHFTPCNCTVIASRDQGYVCVGQYLSKLKQNHRTITKVQSFEFGYKQKQSLMVSLHMKCIHDLQTCSCLTQENLLVLLLLVLQDHDTMAFSLT